MRSCNPINLRQLLLVLVMLPISACNPGVSTTPQETYPELTAAYPTNTIVVPTSTVTASPTLIPTLTPTPTLAETTPPTDTPTTTPTETPTETPTLTSAPILVASSETIVVYLVYLGAEGGDTCKGSLAPLSTGATRAGNTRDDITRALNSLFAIGVKNSGNLYNPLYQSKLSVRQVDFVKNNGQATVYLTGSFVKPKTDCDKQLYRSQVWQTIYQFQEVSRAIVWVNNKLLGDLLVVGDN